MTLVLTESKANADIQVYPVCQGHRVLLDPRVIAETEVTLDCQVLDPRDRQELLDHLVLRARRVLVCLDHRVIEENQGEQVPCNPSVEIRC